MEAPQIVIRMAETTKDWADYLTLCANILGPLLTALFAWLILRATKNIEAAQWNSQKIIEKRISIWDMAGPPSNAIYCFCMRIGDWKDLNPPKVIALKRDLDRIIHINRPFFSEVFFKSYMEFMAGCFSIFQGHGEDAKIRTPVWEHKNAHKDWQNNWEKFFDDDCLSEKELEILYIGLQLELSKDLNIHPYKKSCLVRFWKWLES